MTRPSNEPLSSSSGALTTVRWMAIFCTFGQAAAARVARRRARRRDFDAVTINRRQHRRSGLYLSDKAGNPSSNCSTRADQCRQVIGWREPLSPAIDTGATLGDGRRRGCSGIITAQHDERRCHHARRREGDIVVHAKAGRGVAIRRHLAPLSAPGQTGHHRARRCRLHRPGRQQGCPLPRPKARRATRRRRDAEGRLSCISTAANAHSSAPGQRGRRHGLAMPMATSGFIRRPRAKVNCSCDSPRISRSAMRDDRAGNGPGHRRAGGLAAAGRPMTGRVAVSSPAPAASAGNRDWTSSKDPIADRYARRKSFCKVDAAGGAIAIAISATSDTRTRRGSRTRHGPSARHRKAWRRLREGARGADLWRCSSIGGAAGPVDIRMVRR